MLLTALVTASNAGCRATGPRKAAVAVADLDRRYAAIVEQVAPYGEGGRIVLDTAYRVLRAGQAEGRWPLVGLEDLWVEAIQEGQGLFNDPDRRWGRTTAAETKDMLGQTTIGPWQITVTNVKSKYGRPYGVSPQWSDVEVYAFCRDHPEVQVRMIADYIQEAYATYGRRGPYGIQRYFWLEGYVRGWIGQGRWDKSVLPEPPDGDWQKLTAEMKADTGFYARQIVCGWRGNPRGLLYWLWVSGDTEGIRAVLRTWRDQEKMTWVEGSGDIPGDARPTGEPGNFAIGIDDLQYLAQSPEAHAEISGLVVSLENELRGAGR